MFRLKRHIGAVFLFGVPAAQCPLGIAFMPPSPFSRRLILASLAAVFLFGVPAAQCPLGIAFMPPSPFSRRLILASL
ncbi:hypothetical protein, partial [Mobiluncus sp.]|uniref:hypothetical protein n=1 Tax=Mobiluncus sp. TaxID=47293 RepID=UPI002A91FC52